MKHIVLPLLILFIVYGLFLRIAGIQDNHSYWNDESHVAKYGRAIIETGQAIDASGYGTGLYQAAMYYITALSFYLFGVNEFAGRLPSVLIGTALIATIYAVTRRMLGDKEALVAAFLTAFSQIQLMWSTQLRPYIWLELFTVWVVYFSYQSLKNVKKVIDKPMIIASIIAAVSFLFHSTGLINFLFIGAVFLYKVWMTKQYKYFLLLIPFLLLIIIGIALTPFLEPSYLLRFNTYLYHYFVFLGYHYWWLGLGALFGFISLWDKKRHLAVLLTAGAAMIIMIALFKIHDRYVRYSIPAFPLLYILFSIGIFQLSTYIERLLHLRKEISLSFTFIIIFMWPIYNDKILLTPRQYYALNGDMRENPVVDYKTAFQRIEQLTQGDKSIVIGDAWFDRVLWYMPGQKYILLLDAPEHLPHAENVEEFIEFKKKTPKGIMIVENWQSMTPPELQEYIRSTLKHEFTQKTIPGNEDDPWSISVYSWGL